VLVPPIAKSAVLTYGEIRPLFNWKRLVALVKQVVVVQRVPLVGKVTFVPAVAVKVIGNAPEVVKASANCTFLVAAKVKVSVPAKVIALVLRVVESDRVKVLPLARLIDPLAKVVVSETVKVLPAAILRVLVPLLVIVKPLIVPAAVTLPALLTVNFVCDDALAVIRSPTPSLLTTKVAKLVLPEIEATPKVPAPILLAVSLNLADDEAFEPKSKSKVESLGYSVPLVLFQ